MRYSGQVWDDPQSKTPASVVLTLWILAALAFAGKHKHALIYAKEQGLFSYIPSPSRFSRRLHSLSDWIPLLLPLSKALWEQLSSVEYYILDTLPLPVCENIRAPRCRLAPARIYRGYIPSKRSYFHGLKLHLICTDNQWISEVLLTPGATADVEGLYRLPQGGPELCAQDVGLHLCPQLQAAGRPLSYTPTEPAKEGHGIGGEATHTAKHGGGELVQETQ